MLLKARDLGTWPPWLPLKLSLGVGTFPQIKEFWTLQGIFKEFQDLELFEEFSIFH